MSKQHILDAAVSLALRHGYRNVRRQDVADKACVATGTVSYHFKSMRLLQDAVIRYGVRVQIAALVAQGLADNNRYARTAPRHLKNAAIRLLAA